MLEAYKIFTEVFNKNNAFSLDRSQEKEMCCLRASLIPHTNLTETVN